LERFARRQSMTTLYATFMEISNAERAVGALLDFGVRPEDLSLVRKHADPPLPEEPVAKQATQVVSPAKTDVSTTSGRFGTDPAMVDSYAAGTSKANDDDYDNLSTAVDAEDYDPEMAAKGGLTPTTPEDAGAGAIKGAGIGIGVGALAALGSMFIPGVGLVVGGGALAASLLGLAATTGAGAIAGAVTGYLKDQGMDSHMAEHYAAVVTGGGGLVSVSVPSGNVDESTVRSVLDKYGAANVTNYVRTGQGGYVA
jgi:hypothetical protein